MACGALRGGVWRSGVWPANLEFIHESTACNVRICWSRSVMSVACCVTQCDVRGMLRHAV